MYEDVGLERFIEQQEKEYDLALKEIKNGEKVSCWMWYIFPQIRGLGKSSTSKYYGIKNIEEAIDYLKNETLKHNLLEITQALLDLGNVNIKKVMGFIDDVKLQSSMTLFNEAEIISHIDCGQIFQKVLSQFFNDEKDKNTLAILEEQKNIKNNENKENNEELNKEKEIKNSYGSEKIKLNEKDKKDEINKNGKEEETKNTEETKKVEETKNTEEIKKVEEMKNIEENKINEKIIKSIENNNNI